MGCDIHLYIEYQKKGINDWKIFGDEFRLPRDYDMFGILARVRNKTKYSFKPKGIPTDFSEINIANVPDYHSHSWLNYFEFSEAVAQYEKYYGNCYLEYRIIEEILLKFDVELFPARVVFWFDN